MKQFGKLKIHNNILVRETKEYSQIVLPSSLRNIVYNELHNKMGQLGTDQVWPKIYLHIELYITRQCQCIKRKKTNRAETVPLLTIESQYPFEIVSIDFLKLDKALNMF